MILTVSIDLSLQLNDKQYLWTALNARSRLKQWTGVEELLTAKVSLYDFPPFVSYMLLT